MGVSLTIYLQITAGCLQSYCHHYATKKEEIGSYNMHCNRPNTKIIVVMIHQSQHEIPVIIDHEMRCGPSRFNSGENLVKWTCRIWSHVICTSCVRSAAWSKPANRGMYLRCQNNTLSNNMYIHSAPCTYSISLFWHIKMIAKLFSFHCCCPS